jgi:hypothetical protein
MAMEVVGAEMVAGRQAATPLGHLEALAVAAQVGVGVGPAVHRLLTGAPPGLMEAVVAVLMEVMAV